MESQESKVLVMFGPRHIYEVKHMSWPRLFWVATEAQLWTWIVYLLITHELLDHMSNNLLVNGYQPFTYLAWSWRRQFSQSDDEHMRKMSAILFFLLLVLFC